MCGVIAGNIYQIALPTLVPILVEKDKRDKANGMFGTVMGVSFAITSIASGFVLAYGGILTVVTIALLLTAVSIIALSLITIKEKVSHHDEGKHDK